MLELDLEPGIAQLTGFCGPLSESDRECLAGRRVTVVGLGNIGAFYALLLARMQIGLLQLIDRDRVEEKNLRNQVYGDPRQVGRPKAEVLAEWVHRIAPQTVIRPLVADLEDVPYGRFAESDLCVGALDSLHARQVLGNERAWVLNVPYLDGGVDAGGEWFGKVQQFTPGSACLECSWSQEQYRQIALENPCDPQGPISGRPTLAPAFVGAVVAGVMAAESLKVLLKKHDGVNREIAFDLVCGRWFTSQLRPSPRCRFHHQVCREILSLEVPFAAAIVQDLLDLLHQRFGESAVQLEFRRHIFDSGAFSALRFVGTENLRRLARRRLAELRLTPDDVIPVQQGDQRVAVALRPSTSQENSR